MARRSVGGKRTGDGPGDVGSSPTVSTRNRKVLWRMLADCDRKLSKMRPWWDTRQSEERITLDQKRREIRRLLKARK